MVELLIVAMDGDAAVVRNGAGHGGHARDDTGGWVIAQDGVWRLSGFTTATQDKDLSVTYRHTATFLKNKSESINMLVCLLKCASRKCNTWVQDVNVSWEDYLQIVIYYLCQIT